MTDIEPIISSPSARVDPARRTRGLRQRDNQKHWTVHQDEFFDHFLLGKPKPEWMEKGVLYVERGRRDVTDMFKPKVMTSAPSVQDR
jgi:hypothetical protein